MRRPIAIAVRVEPRMVAPADTLEARLQRLATPLRLLDEAGVRARFELPAATKVLKTTLSLCPDCLAHVPAAVFLDGQRVMIAKHCATHGASRALLENDERYYKLSNKDRWGRRYDETRVDFVPEFSAAPCCGEAEGCAPQPSDAWMHDGADQRGNKSCTVLVEVTDACNLACGVCYADSRGDKMMPLDQFKRTILALLGHDRIDVLEINIEGFECDRGYCEKRDPARPFAG